MHERHIRVQRRMAASTDSVWSLFADFPNLASHWSGLRATRAIGDQTGGVGARRRVETSLTFLRDNHTGWTETARSHPSRVRGLLGWICWGDDVDGDLAESQPDTWSGLHARLRPEARSRDRTASVTLAAA